MTTDRPAAYECPRCAALVTDADKHGTWHRTVDPEGRAGDLGGVADGDDDEGVISNMR